MGRLDGKVALVTGAGRGIGRGIVRALAREGARVVVNDLGTALTGEGGDRSPADQLVREIQATGGQAVANYGSVADFTQAEAMVAQAVEAFGRIDILVNVAGNLRDRMIFNMAEEEWDAVLAVHLKGTFNTCRAASIRFREQKGGRIINMSSTSAFGAPGQPNYAAAKSGILGLTWSCANALNQYNVTANAILPSGWTRMIDSTPRAQQVINETGKPPSEAGVGTDRDPDNVAPVVVWLASDAAQHVNGCLFRAFGYHIGLASLPKVIKTVRTTTPWTVDRLAAGMPQTVGDGLPPAGQQVGYNARVVPGGENLPENAWVEVAPGVKFWKIDLSPYGELR